MASAPFANVVLAPTSNCSPRSGSKLRWPAVHGGGGTRIEGLRIAGVERPAVIGLEDESRPWARRRRRPASRSGVLASRQLLDVSCPGGRNGARQRLPPRAEVDRSWTYTFSLTAPRPRGARVRVGGSVYGRRPGHRGRRRSRRCRTGGGRSRGPRSRPRGREDVVHRPRRARTSGSRWCRGSGSARCSPGRGRGGGPAVVGLDAVVLEAAPDRPRGRRCASSRSV